LIHARLPDAEVAIGRSTHRTARSWRSSLRDGAEWSSPANDFSESSGSIVAITRHDAIREKSISDLGMPEMIKIRLKVRLPEYELT